jgi:hypothetical protein
MSMPEKMKVEQEHHRTEETTASHGSPAASKPLASKDHPLLALQKQIGNRAVTHLLQPKLKVGAANDEYEHEAEQVAEEVMNGLGVQRQPICACGGECPECKAKQDKILQTKRIRTNAVSTTLAPPIVHEVLRRPGQPLDVRTRHLVEPRLNYDFSGVRVHTGAHAEASAQSVNALAYTAGSHIVFNAAQYAPGTNEGLKLLIHELTHVVQQHSTGLDAIDAPLPVVQRQTLFGPGATGAPADWSTRVAAATTSAQRAALVQASVGTGVTVVDRTSESQNDTSPTKAHLVPYTANNPQINYDDNLQNKQSPVDGRSLSNNAGYTLNSDGNSYVVLGRKALNENDFYEARVTLNHEFDHIRQQAAGSRLQGNESEVDAWTSTFIREFHRTYVLGQTATTCYVHRIQQFAPLLFYFTRRDVSDTVRNNSVRRIVDYYNNTLRSHPGHSRVFRFWIHRTLKNSGDQAALAVRLNNELRLGVNAEAGLATTRQFDCAGVRQATYPGPPALEQPAPAGSTPATPGTTPTPARRSALELRGGVSLPEGERSAAFSLGARYSLRPDQAIVFNPLLGAQLLYLPAAGDRTTHLAAAIGEIGLRIQQPVRGLYFDVRTGGYVGLELPGADVEAGLTGAVGFGFRWERLELGAEARGMLDLTGNRDRVIVVGAGAIRF